MRQSGNRASLGRGKQARAGESQAGNPAGTPSREGDTRLGRQAWSESGLRETRRMVEAGRNVVRPIKY